MFNKWIAHRGFSSVAPENTNAAFRKASEASFFGIECDLIVTKDNQIVTFHDYTLNRMTNMHGCVREMTLNELRNISITSGNNIEEYKSLKIPTLDEYLTICKAGGHVAVIELKYMGDVENLNRLIEIINKHQYFHKVIVISFNLDYLVYLRKRYEGLNIQFITYGLSEDIIHTCQFYQFDIDVFYGTLNKAQIEMCHANNLLVNTFALDDEKIAQAFIEYGINFITTNKLR